MPTLKFDVDLERGRFCRHLRIEDTARVIALVDRSGAGKTTVLNAIAGLLHPRRGLIEVNGCVLFDSIAKIDIPAHRRRIGYVFQDTRLFPHLDVSRNLRYGDHHRHPRTHFDFDAVVELLGIASLLSRYPRNLSGGETQRVAIGRALLSQPSLLLFDEPLSSLDYGRREERIPYLQRIRDEIRLPMIYVSHHLDEVEQLAASIHTLDNTDTV